MHKKTNIIFSLKNYKIWLEGDYPKLFKFYKKRKLLIDRSPSRLNVKK